MAEWIGLFVLFVLFNVMWSQQGQSVSCMTMFFFFLKLANHQIRHQATHKVGCQPGDCIWSLYFSAGVWVGTYMYGLTYSLYHPQGLCR